MQAHAVSSSVYTTCISAACFWVGDWNVACCSVIWSLLPRVLIRALYCCSCSVLLPVISAEIERARSTFNVIKTKMRSTTGEDLWMSLSCPNITRTSQLHMRQSLTYMPDAPRSMFLSFLILWLTSRLLFLHKDNTYQAGTVTRPPIFSVCEKCTHWQT